MNVGDTVTLTATTVAGAVYVWSFWDGQNKTTNIPVTEKTLTRSGSLSYTVVAVQPDGSSASESFNISVSPVPIFTGIVPTRNWEVIPYSSLLSAEFDNSVAVVSTTWKIDGVTYSTAGSISIVVDRPVIRFEVIAASATGATTTSFFNLYGISPKPIEVSSIESSRVVVAPTIWIKDANVASTTDVTPVGSVASVDGVDLSDDSAVVLSRLLPASPMRVALVGQTDERTNGLYDARTTVLASDYQPLISAGQFNVVITSFGVVYLSINVQLYAGAQLVDATDYLSEVYLTDRKLRLSLGLASIDGTILTKTIGSGVCQITLTECVVNNWTATVGQRVSFQLYWPRSVTLSESTDLVSGASTRIKSGLSNAGKTYVLQASGEALTFESPLRFIQSHDLTIGQNDEVILQAGVYDTHGRSIDYSWQFWDGYVESGTLATGKGVVQINRTLSSVSPGTYSVILTVVDSEIPSRTTIRNTTVTVIAS
jgi:hypothetical protein